MRCLTDDQLKLLSMNLGEDAEVQAWQEHLETCPSCRRNFQAARRQHIELTRTYEAFDRNHDERREQLMASLPATAPQVRSRTGERGGWRGLGDFVMTHKRAVGRTAIALAPAACIVFALIFFVSSGNGKAFARTIERLRQINTYVCHMKADITGGGLDQQVEGTLYASADHGTRFELYTAGVHMSTLHHITDTSAVMVMPAAKIYMNIAIPEDADPTDMKHQPEVWLERLRELTGDADRYLGVEVREDHEVEGYEIAGYKLGLPGSYDQYQSHGQPSPGAPGPASSRQEPAPVPPGSSRPDPGLQATAEAPSTGSYAQLWVDTTTRLPVQFMLEMPGPMDGSWVSVTHDQFRWDEELDPEMFKPEIPEDYTGMDLTLPSTTEDALIEGLETFAEISGGAYPSTLDSMKVTAELGAALARQAIASGASHDLGDPAVQEMAQTAVTVTGACQFYMRLIRDGHQPEYFGDTVTAADPDAVLLRWHLENGDTRVLYGDLTIETLPAE